MADEAAGDITQALEALRAGDSSALDRLMETYPNLYGDLSEPGGERAIARDPAFGREFIIRRADQLVFGTDVLMPDQSIPQFELLESLNLPDEVRQKIYRDNAIKLLKL